MMNGQNTPQKFETSRALRNQRFRRTSNSNSPVLKTRTKSSSCSEGHKIDSKRKQEVSAIYNTTDLHERVTKIPAETSDEALNLVTEGKTRNDRRARHNADQCFDDESMLSNASTISIATVQCVDKLQISEDARHSFDDTAFNKKHSGINQARGMHDVNDLSSESSDSKNSDIYAGKTTCIQNMYGTDKASWLIDHSTNGSVSGNSYKVIPSTLEQAVDLTIAPHDAQKRTVRNETPINILTLTPTSPHNSLSSPCRHALKPLDLSLESVGKGSSSQSPIPTILSCNATNSDSVSSCGDMKNTGSQLDSSVVQIYARDGVCKSQSGVHQDTLIPIREVSVNTNANNSNSVVDVNNNKEYNKSVDEPELYKPDKVKSDEIQSSTSFKGILKKICPESEIHHVDALSPNSDLNVYRQSYYDEPKNLPSSDKQEDFMRYSHYVEPHYPEEQVYLEKRHEHPHHLQNSSEPPQHYSPELQNFAQLPQDYPQPLQNYTQQPHTYPDQQVDASKVEIYAQQRITLAQQADDSISENTRQQIIGEENSQMTNYMQYTQYDHPIDEEQFAAEQLASELVQNYGGSNSHMISDILKRSDGQNYMHSGFERPNEITYNQLAGSNQSVMHDVDLLNTPQQLMAVDDFKSDVQSQLGDPQAMSTPDLFRKTHQQKVSVTYNDVHLHGGSWTTNKSSVVDMPTQDASESPFPPGSLVTGQAPLLGKDGDDSFYSEDSESSCNLSKCSDIGRRPFMNMKQFQRSSNASSDQPGYLGYGSMPIGRSPPSFNKSNPYVQPQHEITTMTFTPREMMESHLSQNYHYPKKEVVGQQISEMDYSSIYPSRDFIDRTANESYVNKDCKRKRSDSSTPRKRSRTSKYNTDDVPKVPPQMPIVDHMFQKYPPALRRDETSGGKHKYFVVNPSEITHMSAKSLLMKYIDFLIVENEQVTEISKSSNPPVDIYVTEDMYFMDSLKFHVPFPSRKFVEWVANFYPRMNFHDMKFKGQYPRLPKDGDQLIVDHRPTQQILEDTFYYFQRIALNGADSMEKPK